MHPYAAYLRYLVRHKWFVLVECWRIGLYWRGIIHDWSKLWPSEFIPYSRYFFFRHNIRDSSGYYKPTDTGDQDFDFAWFLHTRRNDHHWQYWVLPTEDGVKLLDISEHVVQEMVCDWRGAARAQRSSVSVLEWWDRNRHKMQLSEATVELVEHHLTGGQNNEPCCS